MNFTHDFESFSFTLDPSLVLRNDTVEGLLHFLKSCLDCHFESKT